MAGRAQDAQDRADARGQEGAVNDEVAQGRWSPAAWSIGRPVTTLMLLAVLSVLSAVAWTQIRMELLPSGFTPPFLFVQIPSLASSPEDVSEDIVEPAEEALATLRGLERMRTQSEANSASILLQFRDGTPMDIAYNDVRDRMDDALQEEGDEAPRYFVWKYNPSDDPLALLGISVPPEVASPTVAVRRRLVPLLERVPGITRVTVDGLPDELIAVDVDHAAVRQIPGGLPVLVQRIQQAQATTSGGILSTADGDMPLRILASIEDIEQLKQLSVGPGIALQDIATIARVHEDKQYLYRMNARPGVFISVYRSSEANVVDTSRHLRAVLNNAKIDEPALHGFGFHTFFDQGALIEASLVQLQQSALLGGILAVLCIFIFLRRFTLTLLIALSIPASLLLTVAALYFSGRTLNVLSLTGMMLAVGMLVDNAVVVVEAIDLRFKEGLSRKDAAISGTREVASPVIVSTLTTLIVFLPLTFMSGNETLSFYLSHIGFPVGVGLLASLFLSLAIIPLVAVWVFPRKNPERNSSPHTADTSLISPDEGASATAIAPALEGGGPEDAHIAPSISPQTVPQANLERDPLTRGVRTIAAWTLKRPLDATLCIVFLLGSAWFPFQHVARFDEVDPNLNDLRIAMRFDPGMGWDDKVDALLTYESLLLENASVLGIRDLRVGLGEIGIGDSELRVFLADDGPLERREVRTKVRKLLPALPGVEPEIQTGGMMGSDDNRPTLSIKGENTQELARIAIQVRAELLKIQGIDAVLSSLSGSGDIVRRYAVDGDRAARADVSALMMMAAVDFALKGRNVGNLGALDEALPIRVRQESVDTLASVDQLEVQPMSGVTLAMLSKIDEQASLPTIRRVNRRTEIELTLDTQRKDVEVLEAQIEQALDHVVLPRGVEIHRGGAFDLMGQAGQEQIFTIGMAAIFVFLLVGILFESIVLPFAVLWSVPFAFAGVFWFLFLTGTPFDVMAAVGLLVLVGVVVNTAIVLVDYTRLREVQGASTEDALLDAVSRRFRPIAMTALTTIVGLIPMAVGRASIVGIPYAPLGRAVIGGLLTSTLLSLFVVPLFYLILQRFRAFTSHKLRIGPRA